MDDASLQFAQPLWLAAGAVLAALGLAAFLRADRRRRADLAKLAHPRFHARLVAGWSPALRWTRRGMWLAAIMALAGAAARPQYGYEWREVKRRGIDILFAVDTSRSMLAEDLAPNRLERARLGILDFIERLGGDRVGLVPFAGTAFALCPLTLDYDAFRESLDAIHTDLIPQQGTDIASAIREAERLFDAEGNNHRFLVLITDGEDLEGDVLDAAKAAAEKGTTIYSAGVGSEDGQTIPLRDRFGRVTPLRDEAGEVVTTRLDATTLRKIAAETGGLYVPLGRGAEGLDSIYQERLAVAPKSELAQQLEKVPLERFQWPLGLAIALLMLQAVIGERKPERAKAALASVARRVRPAAMLLGFLAVISTARGADAVLAYNEGTADYENGEFESAVEKLHVSLRTPDLGLQQKAYYNLGSALYRLGQAGQADAKKTLGHWEKALKAFEDSLALAPGDADAAFNRDFVKRKIEELKNQQQDQQDPQQGDQDQQQDQPQDQQQGDQEQKQDPQEQNDGQDGEGKPQQQDSGDPQDKQEPSEKQEESGKPEETKDGGEDGKDGEEAEQRPKGQEEREAPEQAEASGEAGEAKESEPGEQTAGAVAEERKPGEMTKEEALRLLQSLTHDERVVIPLPQSDQQEGKSRANKRKTW